LVEQDLLGLSDARNRVTHCAEQHVVALVRLALEQTRLKPADVSVISFTKGPRIGGPPRVCTVCARTLSMLWKKPLVGVNHCVGHIEMGRVATNCSDPIVVYVSGGNTQVCHVFHQLHVFHAMQTV
jgi:N6-L-threonylcarbamoyladenine synthase